MASERRPGSGTRRLGVLGTLVRDTIHRYGSDRPAEGWGGIAYSLVAFDAVAPPGWTLVPLVKVGGDLYDDATAWLCSFSRVGDSAFVLRVPEPNNRVELVYSTPSDRTETLTGGVPGWSAAEMGEALPALDALYVNFIAGWELDLAAARRVRAVFRGPTYADLHSLFMDIGADGRRRPRPLADAEAWARCFDTVQMNRDEFALFGGDAGDPWAAAVWALAGRTGTIAVTHGDDGVELMTTAARTGPPRHHRLPVPDGPAPGDPTGCGDIWGAAFFAGTLGGDDPIVAATKANRMARGKLRSSGAEAFRTSLAAPESSPASRAM
ncbi:MAG: carbohydrate kinase family protein [Gemmatimonadota bacterium]|nr:carbohydrate kinase family protein [Gemmatimonadota bacterium]MDE2985917.1 carbohydrate kinase family protein [Gemmatimonadota bacterium]